MATPKITAVGSVGLDTIITPSGKREELLGGSVVHFAVSASFLTKVGIVGVAGADFPEEHILFMKDRKIDLEGLELVENGKTFRWTGSYLEDFNMAKTHCTDLNVFADFQPEIPDDYKTSPIVFLANIAPALQLHVIDQMNETSYRICDTMNLWIDNTREELCKVFEAVNIAIMNDGEVRSFTGIDNLIKAGRRMLEYGMDYCVVKKGEHGAMAFGKNNFFTAVPAYPVDEVIDPTGAGDSFAGGFVGYIAEKGDHKPETIKKALRWGSVMGSFNVTDFSCDRFRDTKPEEIKARLVEFENMIG
ncbi:MAG: sugar kinase [Chlamydiae bacterium]|nr:MAG: sugar kinase [Chlamydiota bacterium]